MYLGNTRFFLCILFFNKRGIIKWWVDASFVVHDDTKSRTGLCMSLEKGIVCVASIKQKLITTSSTELELVKLSDEMTKIVWTRHLIEVQEYNDENVYVCQDKKAKFY